MNNDMFDTYFKNHVSPVLKSNSFDNRTWTTLNALKKEGHSTRSAMGIFVFQVALILVLFVIVMPGSQAILSTPWLKAYSSEDGQQYIIEGIQPSVGTIKEADAAYSEGIWTDSVSELEEFLDVELKISISEIGNWTPEKYYGMRATEGLMFSVKYVNQSLPNEVLFCSMRACYDIQSEYDRNKDSVDDGCGMFDEVEGNLVYCEYSGENRVWTVRAVVDDCVIEAQGYAELDEVKAVVKMLLDSYESLSEREKSIWEPTGEKDGHPLELVTTDLGELNTFCGSRLMLPVSIPKGWEVASLRANISDFLTTASLKFVDIGDSDKRLTISIQKPDESDDITMYYEQNEPGKVIRYRGKEIYVSYNMDRILAVYLEDNTFYAIMGSINLDEAKMFFDHLFRVK